MGGKGEIQLAGRQRVRQGGGEDKSEEGTAERRRDKGVGGAMILEGRKDGRLSDKLGGRTSGPPNLESSLRLRLDAKI